MARKKHQEEHENHERWLVSYADFITLLFAFFVVMYAVSTKDLEKSKEFEQSIRKYFNMNAVIGAGNGGGSGSSPGSNSVDQLLKDEFPALESGPVEITDFVKRSLEKKIGSKSLQEQGVNVRHDAVGARIQLSAATFFSQGSAYLRPEAIQLLDQVAESIKNASQSIVVEGHTDDLQIDSKLYPSNWELGAARASVIVRYLIKRHGVPAQRLVALSYADQKPIVKNDSELNRARNRRVEILIVAQSET